MTTTKTKTIPVPRDIEPVGLAEIAERMGVRRAAVDKWQTRGLLPEARWTVGGRPAWNFGDIVRWARDTNRNEGEYRSSYEGSYQLENWLRANNGKEK